MTQETINQIVNELTKQAAKNHKVSADFAAQFRQALTVDLPEVVRAFGPQGAEMLRNQVATMRAAAGWGKAGAVAACNIAAQLVNLYDATI